MIDCPCGHGKNIKETQKTCPICGLDVTPLHKLRAFPRSFYQEGWQLADKGEFDSALELLTVAKKLGYDSEEVGTVIEEVKKKQATNGHRGQNTGEKKKHFGLLLVPVVLASLILGLAIGSYLNRPNEQSNEREVSQPPAVEEIRRRIAAYPDLEQSKVEVKEINGDIKIYGTVPSEAHRSLIAEIAKNAAGKSSVDMQELKVSPKTEPHQPTQRTHVIAQGDTLETIAKKAYGKRTMWQKIYDANRDKIRNPHKLKLGVALSLPD